MPNAECRVTNYKLLIWVRGWKGMVGGVMTPPYGVRRGNWEAGGRLPPLRVRRGIGGRPMGVPTGCGGERRAITDRPPFTHNSARITQH